MGEIGTEFERDWIYPLGTAELDGRPMPVPARPEKLLEAMYGPSWQAPDPAFKFSTPDPHHPRVRRLVPRHPAGQPVLGSKRAHVMAHKPLRQTPSTLAKRALALAAPLGAEVLDIGAGRGCRQPVAGASGPLGDGVRLRARARSSRRRTDADGGVARPRGPLPQPHRMAVGASPRVLGWRSRPRPRVVLARHVVDATSGTRPGVAGAAVLDGIARRRAPVRRVPPADRRRGPRTSSGWSGDPTLDGVHYAAARRRRLPRRACGSWNETVGRP